MGERRAWKARAQGKMGGAVLSRELLRVGLLAQVRVRVRVRVTVRELLRVGLLAQVAHPDRNPYPDLNPNPNP